MFQHLQGLFFGLSVSKSRARDEDRELTAEEIASKREMAPIIAARNQKESPLLRLPAEIRNQIYTYLDFGGHTIEVLQASNKSIDILNKNGDKIRNATSSESWERLFFRIELDGDKKKTTKPPNPPLFDIGKGKRIYRVRRKRCASVQGLFSFQQVCRQLRAESMLLMYELNTFAFTDRGYNYITALRSWVLSLSAPQKAATRSIRWPLRQAGAYQRMLNGIPLQLPDQDCSTEFAQLSGLTNVVLRWLATDIIPNITLSDSEKIELAHECARNSGGSYYIKRAFQRTLAERGMQHQVGRTDVDITNVHSWRTVF